MKALARITEYITAPVAERKRRELGEEKPNPSRKLNAKKRREKQVAFAERMTMELHIWVRRMGL